MNEIAADRVGSALRKLAEEAVVERRVVARLRRENRDLRAQLAALESLDPATTLLDSTRKVTIAATPEPAISASRPQSYLVGPEAPVESILDVDAAGR